MLTNDRIRELARAGARARIHDLQAEIAELEESFPEDPAPSAMPMATAPDMPAPAQGHRRTMSAAERKAASVRMKAVWRAKKAAEAR